MSQHTPGPWHWEPDDELENVGVYAGGADDRIVCDVTTDEVGIEQRNANAHLIAAAPDLLAACEELKAAFMDGCGEATSGPKRRRLIEAGAKMDAAINKAKGQ